MRRQDNDKTPFLASALVQGAKRRRLGNALAAVSVALALAGAGWGGLEAKGLLDRQGQIALASELATLLRAAVEARQDLADARRIMEAGGGGEGVEKAAGKWGLAMDRYGKLGKGRALDEATAAAMRADFAQALGSIKTKRVGPAAGPGPALEPRRGPSLVEERLAGLMAEQAALQGETAQRLGRARWEFAAWALSIAALVGWAMRKERSASRRVEELALRLAHEATHDALTGLPNRRFLHARLNESWSEALAGTPGLCVLYMDLDGFSQINNTLGHEAGDHALRAVAGACAAALGGGGFLARIGGDEFVALGFAGEAAAVAAGQAMVDKVAALAPVEGAPVGILGVSVGVASASDGWGGPAELLAAADEAMYQAKRDGKRCVRVAEAPAPPSA